MLQCKEDSPSFLFVCFGRKVMVPCPVWVKANKSFITFNWRLHFDCSIALYLHLALIFADYYIWRLKETNTLLKATQIWYLILLKMLGYFFVCFLIWETLSQLKAFPSAVSQVSNILFFPKNLELEAPSYLQSTANFGPLQSVHGINSFVPWKGFSRGFHLRDVEESQSPTARGEAQIEGHFSSVCWSLSSFLQCQLHCLSFSSCCCPARPQLPSEHGQLLCLMSSSSCPSEHWLGGTN